MMTVQSDCGRTHETVTMSRQQGKRGEKEGGGVHNPTSSLSVLHYSERSRRGEEEASFHEDKTGMKGVGCVFGHWTQCWG